METLKIDKKKARKLFPSASKEFKEMLIDTFGHEYFSDDVTKQVESFDDACELIGIIPESVINAKDSKDEIAYKKLKIISRALNGDWEADFDNSNQQKWFPWFKGGASGSGFSYSTYGYSRTYPDLGSRLCFKSEKLADYAGKQFTQIYKDFLI